MIIRILCFIRKLHMSDEYGIHHSCAIFLGGQKWANIYWIRPRINIKNHYLRLSPPPNVTELLYANVLHVSLSGRVAIDLLINKKNPCEQWTRRKDENRDINYLTGKSFCSSNIIKDFHKINFMVSNMHLDIIFISIYNVKYVFLFCGQVMM